MHPDFLEGRMPRVDEPIAFSGRQNRGNDHDRSTPTADELVPDPGKCWRSRYLPPVLGELPWSDRYSGDIVRNIRHDYDEVHRGMVGVEVDEIFHNGQRQVLGGIGEANAWARPASAKPVRALPVERPLCIGPAQDSVYPSQLTPPYAILPRTFSTALAPISVSIISIGTLPPNARLARFSH